MTAPSRGSALYAATLVTIGAAAGARFFMTTPDLAAASARGAAAGAQTAGAGSATPSATSAPAPTATGSALTWARGSHPTPSPTPSPTRPSAVPTQRPSPTATRSAAPAVKPAAPPAPAAPPRAAPVTTVVVGSTAQTPYGPVQVQVTFTGGAITAVQALQAPSGGYSSQVSSFALPVLSSEAVAAGSANIASVSGASYTSAGYKQSLQYAIDHKG